MRESIIGAVCACLAVVSFCANAASFQNGNFETGELTPWYQNRVFSIGEDWNITNTDTHTGTFSVTNTGNKELRQDFDGILTDSIVELSLWIKHDSLGSNGAAIDLFYSDNTKEYLDANTSTLNWEYFDLTGSLTPNKTLIGFSVFGNAYGRTYLDDVTISTVPVPAAVWLFGSGLIGLIGLARRKSLQYL